MTAPIKNAVYYLEIVAEEDGEPELLSEVCEALGFVVRDGDVFYKTAPVARIADGQLSLNPKVSGRLRNELKPLNQHQSDTFTPAWFRFARYRMAVHEAGHAIAAIKFGFGVDLVSIDSRPPVTKCCKEPCGHERQLYYAAGAAAETLVFDSYVFGFEGDLVEIVKQSPEACFTKLVDEAMERLDRTSIEKVACELMVPGVLLGSQVEDLIWA